ncbi:MAG: preprotein translocase subunit SecG, partial [Oligosphaeraceae bacterium]|nr:preprotein translocase subunit SecG [Oligosphaeraceae bacterium]
MAFLTVLLSILAVLSGILMIVFILLQNNKSGGGLGAVSGGVTETMFGTAASSVLLKVTVWLAVIFMGSTLLLATVTGRIRGIRSVAETLVPAAEEPSAAVTVPGDAEEDVTAAQDTATKAV